MIIPTTQLTQNFRARTPCVCLCPPTRPCAPHGPSRPAGAPVPASSTAGPCHRGICFADAENAEPMLTLMDSRVGSLCRIATVLNTDVFGACFLEKFLFS